MGLDEFADVGGRGEAQRKNNHGIIGHEYNTWKRFVSLWFERKKKKNKKSTSFYRIVSDLSLTSGLVDVIFRKRTTVFIDQRD